MDTAEATKESTSTSDQYNQATAHPAVAAAATAEAESKVLLLLVQRTFNNPKFNFKDLHLIKTLAHHTLVVFNGDNKPPNQRHQNQLHTDKLTHQRKTNPTPCSHNHLPVGKREWTKTVTTSQQVRPNNSNNLKQLQSATFLTLELRIHSQQRPAVDLQIC